MLANFDLQTILLFITFPLILSQCSREVNQCYNKFAENLDTHKSTYFKEVDEQLNNICDSKNGIFFKFVDCVKSTEQTCTTDSQFSKYLCETRKLKMRIYRYNWKASMFYTICQNTSSQLSRGFIEFEPCISTILNNRKWKCDNDYDKPIKSMGNWRDNTNTVCSLWRKFRECTKQDVSQTCGSKAAEISDYLFHSYQSYFEKYSTCELDGHQTDQCWYDLVKHEVKDTQPLITTTPLPSTQPILTEQTQQSFATDLSTQIVDSNRSDSNHNEFTVIGIHSGINSSHSNQTHENLRVSETENILNPNELENHTEKDVLSDNSVDSLVTNNESNPNTNSNDKLTLSNKNHVENEKPVNNYTPEQIIESNNAYDLKSQLLYLIINTLFWLLIIL